MIFRRLYWWQVGRFFRDAERDVCLPLQRRYHPAREQLRSSDNFRSSANHIRRQRPPTLTSEWSESFMAISLLSELYLLPSARHIEQMDEPEEVARLILSTPANKI